MKKHTEILELILLLVIVAVSCFFIGKHFGAKSMDIASMPGETITGYVPEEKLTPTKEETPADPELPKKEIQIEIQYKDTGSVKTETKYITRMQVVDTAAIIADYIVKRSYSQILFNNNQFGKLEVFPTVYQNKLTALEYEYKPKIKACQPFISSSYSTTNYLGIGGGFFYYNLGVEYQYQIDLNRSNTIDQARGNAHLIGLKYKFR